MLETKTGNGYKKISLRKWTSTCLFIIFINSFDGTLLTFLDYIMNHLTACDDELLSVAVCYKPSTWCNSLF